MKLEEMSSLSFFPCFSLANKGTQRLRMHLGIQSDVVIHCTPTNNLLHAEGISVYFGPLNFECW
jgi:hypothetical protein